MSVLIVNVADIQNAQVDHAIKHLGECAEDSKLLDLTSWNIQGCKGCFTCMLATPGKCCIQDDGERFLKEILSHDKIVFIFDTAFSFIDYKGIHVVDRLFPLVNITIEYKEKEIWHIPRYDKKLGVGVLYTGKANHQLFQMWYKRFIKNFRVKPLGITDIGNIEEACQWML